MSATDELRRMLDERGVEWGNVRNDGSESNFFTEWQFDGIDGRATATEWSAGNNLSMAIYRWSLTPEQAIEATLGREPWVSPTWERWHKSLRHDEIKSIGDAVEQLMYEVIEFGGDMGPNGNTYNGIDEGDVLTADYINEWVARFESMLGRGTCHITVQDNMTETEGMGDVWLECDACGWQMPLEPSTPRFNYCPNCGRRIEVVEQ